MDSGLDLGAVGVFGIAFFGFIALIFAVVFGGIGFVILRGLLRWSRNNASPLSTVPARVLAKRAQLSGGSGDSATSTSYFVTFELQGGARQELPLNGPQFGVLVEGDQGRLSYQGTRYKGFDRSPQDL